MCAVGVWVGSAIFLSPIALGRKVPGPIDNSRLVDQCGEPHLGLQAVQDYRGVNRAIWAFWHDRYGGGRAHLSART
eukprot:15485074-Alexandrium_andersonii.AAC.1